MRAAVFLWLWLAILGVLSFEYFQLHQEKHGLVVLLMKSGVITKSLNTSPEPGRPISLFLGWSGISVMILTNLYILRKRMALMQGWGKLSNWLNFHIFCGLTGPTFIIFHSDFHARGLVAVSFWSMIISASSGVIGRYFYLQLARFESEFQDQAEFYMTRLKRLIEKRGGEVKDETLERYKHQALVTAGAIGSVGNPFSVFARSFAGDIRMLVHPPTAPPEAGDLGPFALKSFAVNKRRARYLESFRRLMGYWHTFHLPFAIFMYVAAAFHIAAALILGVKK